MFISLLLSGIPSLNTPIHSGDSSPVRHEAEALSIKRKGAAVPKKYDISFLRVEYVGGNVDVDADTSKVDSS